MPTTKVVQTRRLCDGRIVPLPALATAKAGDILYDFDAYECVIL